MFWLIGFHKENDNSKKNSIQKKEIKTQNHAILTNVDHDKRMDAFKCILGLGTADLLYNKPFWNYAFKFNAL